LGKIKLLCSYIKVSGYNSCTKLLKVMISVFDKSQEYYHCYTFYVHF